MNRPPARIQSKEKAAREGGHKKVQGSYSPAERTLTAGMSAFWIN